MYQALILLTKDIWSSLFAVLKQAIAFINKIKDRFAQHEGRVYESFLELLCSFKERKVNASSIYREVAVLFQDNEDLLEEFKHFLPEQGWEDGQWTEAAMTQLKLI